MTKRIRVFSQSSHQQVSESTAFQTAQGGEATRFERMRSRPQKRASGFQRRGKTTALIPGATDGQVTIWNASGATSETVDVTNPYLIDLPADFFVRLVTIKGWDLPFAVPDEFTLCEELAPDQVAPLVGS